MSVGVLPHVADTRSIDEYFADKAAHAQAEALDRARPQMESVARILAGRVPGWQELPAEQQEQVAFEIVQAVEVGF